MLVHKRKLNKNLYPEEAFDFQRSLESYRYVALEFRDCF